MFGFSDASSIDSLPIVELISGFCTIEVPVLSDALPWAEKYIAAVGEVEIDLRPLYEPAELG